MSTRANPISACGAILDAETENTEKGRGGHGKEKHVQN